MARHGQTPFDIQKAALWYRRSDVERKILDTVRLLAYTEDAIAGGCPDVSKEMHAELEAFAKQLREIDSARWTIERLEREAREATEKVT